MAYHPFRHLGLKLISLVIAVALWFLVAGEQTVERSLRAQLELQNTPEQLVLVENPPAAVDVRVRGTAGLLRQLSAADVVAIVDLSTARPGRRLFHLTTDHVRAPFGVEVTQVSPGTIPLVFERSGSRTVPVVPSVEGEPAEGYRTGTVSADPAAVEVIGPESALRSLRAAMTEPVSVQGARRPVRESATIGVADPSLRLRQPRSAIVNVDVYPIPVQRAVMNVPVRVRNLGRGLSTQSIVPSLVTVLVKGRKEVLDALQPDSVPAFVDLAGLGPGRYNLTVKVEPSQDFEVVRITPPAVRVRLVR